MTESSTLSLNDRGLEGKGARNAVNIWCGKTLTLQGLRIDQVSEHLAGRLSCNPHYPELPRGTEVGMLVGLVVTLHLKVARRQIKGRLPMYTLESFQIIVSGACETEDIAIVVTQLIWVYVSSIGATLIAVRATAVCMLGDEESIWPVVEWIEHDGTARLAIFQFDDETKQVSWIMHSGMPTDDSNSWQQSRVDWNVASTEDLKILFRVTRHVLEVLEWSVEDAIKLYCQVPSETTSEEE